MRVLHVAALPFPSPQGTQAAIASMLSALLRAGERPTLLTYAGGAGEPIAGLEHEHAEGSGGVALRSGPSARKLRADAALARAIGRRRPDVIVAHHVEAALAALAAGRAPVLFVAHTALGPELPTYFGPLLSRPLSAAGEALDRFLLRRAHATAAVSPRLATMLSSRSGRAVHPLPIPWPVPPEPSKAERAVACAELGLDPQLPVVLYAGNLDAYQGLDVLGAALEEVRRRRELQFLLATESAPLELVRHLGPRTLARTRRSPLRSEADRRRAHAAASVVVVPRRAPGGIPVKLLDALARGVPVAAPRRALAGHPLDALCATCDDDDPRALADAIDGVLDEAPAERARRAHRAREHMRHAHGDAAFVAAYRQALADAQLAR